MRPVHIDGLIFVAIAVFGSIGSALGADDAAKWIEPKMLWFARNGCTAFAAGFLALKMYRSTTYAKDREQNGQLTKPPEPPIVKP